MEFEDWKKLKPCSVHATESYLKHPKSHRSIVIYKTKDDVLMVLNPFGGGICNTQELVLKEPFKLTEETVKNVIIFTLEE